MLTFLAQSDRDQALSEGYWGIVLILVIGLLTILIMVAMFLGRRWRRRQLEAIEKDKAERRTVRSAERIDAWKAGSDRYVDHDKLPDDVPYDTEPDEADDLDDPDESDEPGDGGGLDEEDAPPPAWDEPEPGQDEQEDPYGLFEDVPFRETEEEEEDDEADDDGWEVEDEDEDEGRDKKEDGPR